MSVSVFDFNNFSFINFINVEVEKDKYRHRRDIFFVQYLYKCLSNIFVITQFQITYLLKKIKVNVLEGILFPHRNVMNSKGTKNLFRPYLTSIMTLELRKIYVNFLITKKINR